MDIQRKNAVILTSVAHANEQDMRRITAALI